MNYLDIPHINTLNLLQQNKFETVKKKISGLKGKKLEGIIRVNLRINR